MNALDYSSLDYDDIELVGGVHDGKVFAVRAGLRMFLTPLYEPEPWALEEDEPRGPRVVPTAVYTRERRRDDGIVTYVFTGVRS